MHSWRYATGGGEVGAKGKRAPRHRTAYCICWTAYGTARKL